jgi:hypothetical protein
MRTDGEAEAMVFRIHKFIGVAAFAIVLSSCAGSGFAPERFRTPPAPPPLDLGAGPAGGPPAGAPVGDPLTANPEQNVAAADNQAAPDAVAGDAASSVAIGRTDLLGGWKVAAGSDSCELFMSLTGWAGGYRATTKGCASSVLTSVQAWNLNEREIVLISGKGETVASLYATSKTRFNGQTGDGIGITVFR